MDIAAHVWNGSSLMSAINFVALMYFIQLHKHITQKLKTTLDQWLHVNKTNEKGEGYFPMKRLLAASVLFEVIQQVIFNFILLYFYCFVLYSIE